jgi:endonuclease/exonuclease/phosphatase family metal-dependent hydrolase
VQPAGFTRAGNLFNTFPAVMPLRPLDGIFVRGDLRCAHCGTRHSEVARAASDHLPLVAELDLL